MKTKLILILSAMLAIAFTAAAVLPEPSTGFAVGTTNGASTLSYAIVSARSKNGGAPRVQYLNAGSDKAGSKVQFYVVGSEATINSFSNSTTTLYVLTTNTPGSPTWQSGTCIIRHIASDTYEKRTLAANSSSTNIVVTAAPYQTAPGDKVYWVTTAGAGTINWGVSTNGIGPSGGGIYVGQVGKPLLLEIDATTAGAINVVSGEYLP